ncbi:hypothetical protein KFU94_29165 [Chloroflexi bacterium TSY]|nr:hypothetical protein [Chloroflexi bacterium TSY]
MLCHTWRAMRGDSVGIRHILDRLKLVKLEQRTWVNESGSADATILWGDSACIALTGQIREALPPWSVRCTLAALIQTIRRYL